WVSVEAGQDQQKRLETSKFSVRQVGQVRSPRGRRPGHPTGKTGQCTGFQTVFRCLLTVCIAHGRRCHRTPWPGEVIQSEATLAADEKDGAEHGRTGMISGGDCGWTGPANQSLAR